ncbi:MAG: 1,3-beta-glucanosyltransferase gas1 [Chaenotheca gracillima]|nr:MAG: 1,3-beta-glucanosyltransferase gas1 [Chaenotheca gracillima]
MAALDLTMEDVEDDIFTEKSFNLLHDFLQPTTTLTLESTADSILEVLSSCDPEGLEVWDFGETCIMLAEQIPYHHPSQLKLVRLLEYLGKPNSLEHGVFRYQRLGESLRESLDSVDREKGIAYANFHAFAANLREHRIFRTDPTWAIWAQREAHEGVSTRPNGSRDVVLLAAAQWILLYGQTLFKQIVFTGDISPREVQFWKPGPLYDGQADLSLQRWYFWRDGFKSAASGEKEQNKGLGQECKSVAAKAADMMDSLERNMTFQKT